MAILGITQEIISEKCGYFCNSQTASGLTPIAEKKWIIALFLLVPKEIRKIWNANADPVGNFIDRIVYQTEDILEFMQLWIRKKKFLV